MSIGSRRFGSILVVCATALVACDAPTIPEGAAIALTAAVNGGGGDPDGFRAELDGSTIIALAADIPTIVEPLASGGHRVRLLGLSRNCAVNGDEEQRVEATAGDTLSVRFEVVCIPSAGALQLVLLTSGLDLDPNGYAVVADGQVAANVRSNGNHTISLPAGAHTLGLEGVSANCAVQGENPRSVSISPEGLSVARFTVLCMAAPPAGPGHELVFVTDRELSNFADVYHVLYLMNEDGAGLRPLPILDTDLGDPDWSPGGDRLVLAHRVDPADGLAIADVASGMVTSIPNTTNGITPAWSPDGAWIAYTEVSDDSEGFSQIVMTTPDGTQNSRLTADSSGACEHPAWSVDGTALAYVRSASDGSATDIRLLNLADHSETVVRSFPGEAFGISGLDWSPDGTQVVFSRRDAQGHSQLNRVIVGDESPPVQLTFGANDSQAPAWSPDGSKIVFTVPADDGDFQSEVYVIDSRGGTPDRLTDSHGMDDSPAWRPASSP